MIKKANMDFNATEYFFQLKQWVRKDSWLKGIEIHWTSQGLTRVQFVGADHKDLLSQACDRKNPHELNLWQTEFIKQLQKYFCGEKQDFSGVPIDFTGAQICSEFDQLVYAQAQKLQFGQVLSYGELAKAIGRPK